MNQAPNLIDLFSALLSGVEGLKSQFLAITILFSLVQFAVVLLVMVFAVLNRKRLDRGERRMEGLKEIWYDELFHYLEEPERKEGFLSQILKRDGWNFLEFLKEFLLDLEGKDKHLIIELIEAKNLKPLLYQDLTHRSQWKRAYAAYYLGLIEDQSSILRLTPMLEDPSPSVSLQVASVLMKLKHGQGVERVLLSLGKLGKDFRSRVDFIFLEYGAEVLPELEKAFELVELKNWLRLVLIDVFRYYRDYGMSERLVFLYDCTLDMETKIACIKALTEFEDPGLLPFFQRALNDPNPAIQAFAVKALGMIGTEEEVELIAPLIASERFWVVQNLVNALKEMGEPGHRKLKEMLRWDLPPINRSILLENARHIVDQRKRERT